MDKAAWRSKLLADRRSAGVAARAAASAAITSAVLRSDEIARLETDSVVAAYVSFGTEPSTVELISGLLARRLRVIVPVLLDDRQLEWTSVAQAEGSSTDASLPTGTSLPTEGAQLGIDTISEAALMIVPALACDRQGTRLGRGGGSYDRALTHVSSGTPVCALLYAAELVDELPRDPHDRGVTMAALPSGIVRL